MSGQRLRFALEDRFIIFDLTDQEAMLPEGNVLEELTPILEHFAKQHTPIFDWRGQQEVPHDVVDLICTLHPHVSTVLSDGNEEAVTAVFGPSVKTLNVRPGSLPINYSTFPVGLFDDHAISDGLSVTEYTGIGMKLPNDDEWRDVREIYAQVATHFTDEQTITYNLDEYTSYSAFAEDYFQDWVAYEADGDPEATISEYMNTRCPFQLSVYLARLRGARSAMERAGRNSLLVEYAFQVSPAEVSITPYHAHALHNVETEGGILVARPGVIARKVGATLSPQLRELEYLVKDPSISERDLQKFLERHPEILNAMGYAHIYPQVVLERDDGSSLRPDFILEPLGNDWCDILDIKLPRMKTVVGRRDRKTFSSAVHELLSQLREYSAYFEDEQLAARIEAKYGIKCYRPKLIGIIGMDPGLSDERQLRRLATMYVDADIVTFDRLITIAKRRLLI